MRGSAYRHGWRKCRFCRSKNRPCAPIARNLSSRSSFALYSTYSLIHRHCLRPRIVRRVVRHDPRPVHPGGPVNDGSFRRAIGADKTAAAAPASFYWARCARKSQKPKAKSQKAKNKNWKLETGNGKREIKLFRLQAAITY